jgi:REP element-mobilizing transposase RayT
MPRKHRIAFAHCPHHLVQRGHNRQAVFVTDTDRLTYLATLREFRGTLRLKVYGYCLMTNHVHLIIDPGDEAASLSMLMKRLAGRHTRRINRLERRYRNLLGRALQVQPHRVRPLSACLHPLCRSQSRACGNGLEAARLLLVELSRPNRPDPMRMAGPRSMFSRSRCRHGGTAATLSRLCRTRHPRTRAQAHPRRASAQSAHRLAGLRRGNRTKNR